MLTLVVDIAAPFAAGIAGMILPGMFLKKAEPAYRGIPAKLLQKIPESQRREAAVSLITCVMIVCFLILDAIVSRFTVHTDAGLSGAAMFLTSAAAVAWMLGECYSFGGRVSRLLRQLAMMAGILFLAEVFVFCGKSFSAAPP